ncbi:MAG: peptide chain release factor N(5)-glutamine methyltransferase [Thermovibrio sp.]|nr:MAG: peptide chain release factor N(5)-glutamine methyltransferase [Thermovibrio sp.]
MEWTVGSLVKRATEILRERGSKTPRLDAELLLVHSLGLKSRVELYTNFERPLSEDEVENYRKLIVRRAKGEPVAYITGKREFFGFEFFVDKGVLIPRPETELLVEVVFEFLRNKEGLTVVDVGTGSGCIVLTLCKLTGERHKFFGIDISKKALEISEKNREKLGCFKVEFLKGDLLSPIDFSVDVVVSNPPYVSVNDPKLEREVLKFEPAGALFGGRTGLEVIERLVEQSSEKLKRSGLLALEVGIGQSEKVRDLLRGSGFEDIKTYRDLSGIERVVTGVKG